LITAVSVGIFEADRLNTGNAARERSSGSRSSAV
jgi:hypothetical protein